MNKSAREIACLGTTVAIMIASQLALSAVSGIEVVTAIFAVYCLVFGMLRGVIVATAFSLVRCFLFGFMPQVILLYIIYYNLFAVVVGVVGRITKEKKLLTKIISLTVSTVILTLSFTAIDNLLNVVLFQLTSAAIKMYVAQSIPVAITQAVCAAVTVPLFFFPLYKVFTLVKQGKQK